ncbi:hypothetical protein [Gordonia insulae]|uniref:hypothetical protein n=1 Tax=Gordonia insulae TaxID=2420509 RepID=UPI000F5BD4DB|nr:hypothetical protein [Gordonia insulae]
MSVGVVGLVMAGPASAATTKVEITTPSGYGLVQNRYGTNCSYEVAGTVDDYSADAETVTITAKPPTGAVKTLYGPQKPAAGTVTGTWKPTVRGSWTITAAQGTSTKSVTVQVGTGTQLPPFILGGGCLITAP